MSDLFGKLKSGANKVAFEADKMTRVNRAKGELDQLNRALETLFSGLGKAVYAQADGGEPVVLEEWQAKIEEQKSRIQGKEREVAAINSETFQQPGAAPKPAPVAAAPVQAEPIIPVAPSVSDEPAAEDRFCTNCGAKVPASSKFCTECGTRV
jgi:hypothetical protein